MYKAPKGKLSIRTLISRCVWPLINPGLDIISDRVKRKHHFTMQIAALYDQLGARRSDLQRKHPKSIVSDVSPLQIRTAARINDESKWFLNICWSHTVQAGISQKMRSSAIQKRRIWFGWGHRTKIIALREQKARSRGGDKDGRRTKEDYFGKSPKFQIMANQWLLKSGHLFTLDRIIRSFFPF